MNYDELPRKKRWAIEAMIGLMIGTLLFVLVSLIWNGHQDGVPAAIHDPQPFSGLDGGSDAARLSTN